MWRSRTLQTSLMAPARATFRANYGSALVRRPQARIGKSRNLAHTMLCG